jgi:flagellar secretion chaperone FliS
MAQHYESQSILSASPMELILLVYDHGLRCLGKAQDAFDENGDIDRMNSFHEHLLEAQNCITELVCSLDVERGGEMAVQIERLYEFMLHHLMESNRLGRREPVDDVKRMLTELRDGWAQAMASVPREQQPEPVPVGRSRSSFNFDG